jgi:hypothetical protein
MVAGILAVIVSVIALFAAHGEPSPIGVVIVGFPDILLEKKPTDSVRKQ